MGQIQSMAENMKPKDSIGGLAPVENPDKVFADILREDITII